MFDLFPIYPPISQQSEFKGKAVTFGNKQEVLSLALSSNDTMLTTVTVRRIDETRSSRFMNHERANEGLSQQKGSTKEDLQLCQL